MTSRCQVIISTHSTQHNPTTHFHVAMSTGKKKGDAKKQTRGDNDDGHCQGKDPAVLLASYKKACVTIGLPPPPNNDPVVVALKPAENENYGKQIVICAEDGESDDNLLGPGQCRALAVAISGRGYGLPVTETGEPIVFTLATDLRICRSRLSDDGAVALAELLRLGAKELNISFLELMDCKIGHRGAFALGRSLSCATNTTLTSLRLDHNSGLKSEGISLLCLGLRTNSTLKSLSVQYCDIDSDGAEGIAEMLSFKKSVITSLNLTGNKFGGKGLATLSSKGLPQNSSLVELVVADNGIRSTADDVSALDIFGHNVAAHPSLTTIDLMHNYIGDEGGRALLPSLQDNKRVHTIKIEPKSVLDEAIFNALNRCSSSTKGKGKKKKGGKKKTK